MSPDLALELALELPLREPPPAAKLARAYPGPQAHSCRFPLRGNLTPAARADRAARR